MRTRPFSMLATACLTVLVAGSARGELSVGTEAPAFEAAECFNTPPLTMQDLAGQVVFLEIFRTW